MSEDVIVYDASGRAGAFGPLLNRSKPTGGTEIHATQLCEGFASAGFRALGVSDIPEPETSSSCARYAPTMGECSSRALVTIGLSQIPTQVATDRHAVLWTHIPDHNIPHIQHLRYSRIVCVSKWQASRFPFGWDAVSIPPIVDDWIYDLPAVKKNPKKYVCVSAWWKGGADTLVAWERHRPPGGSELHFGSPYSHPANLREIVERVPGAVYVDLTDPVAVVESMRDAVGVFRVSLAPETFGVTDVIAQILGCRTHVLAVNGMGGLAESLAQNPWASENFDKWREGLREVALVPDSMVQDAIAVPWGKNYRSEKIIPQWVRLLGLE